MTNLLFWLALGLITGVTAYLIDPEDLPGGLTNLIVLGVLGAVSGGIMGNLLLGANGFNFPALAIAIFGSLITVMLQRAFLRRL